MWSVNVAGECGLNMLVFTRLGIPAACLQVGGRTVPQSAEEPALVVHPLTMALTGHFIVTLAEAGSVMMTHAGAGHLKVTHT